jgi:leucyl-tRNA synthetase
MSKSKGNVVEPTLMIDRYGADTVRLFCLFAAPPERDIDWSESGIEGAYRFAGRVWRLCVEWQTTLPLLAPCSSTPAQAAASPAARALRRREHLTVKKATEDIGNRFQFNTAIAAVMELINALYLAREELARPDAAQGVAQTFSSALATVLALLFPIMPHLCEELWETTGHAGRLEDLPWPVWSEEALEQDMATVVIQVNGKLRGKLDVAAGTDARDIERLALAEPNIARHLDGLIVRRVVVIPDKLVNVVAN